MEELPQFIKKFSKKESSEEWQQAIKLIRDKRVEHFTKKRVQEERQAELQQVTSERERILTEQLESIYNLENEITKLSTSRLGEILNYLKLKKSGMMLLLEKEIMKN